MEKRGIFKGKGPFLFSKAGENPRGGGVILGDGSGKSKGSEEGIFSLAKYGRGGDVLSQRGGRKNWGVFG